MKFIATFAALLLAALLTCRASAGVFTLRNGVQLDADEIAPDGEWLKLKLVEGGEAFVAKSDLSSEQVNRYFGCMADSELTFETRKTGDNVEYVYFDKGRETGRRIIGADGKTVRAMGKVTDGVYKESYPGAGVEKTMDIINGRQNGVFKVYFPGGRVQSETYFLNDMLHGPRRVFDENGEIISEENFMYGELEGTQGGGLLAGTADDPEDKAQADPPPQPAAEERPARLFTALQVFSVSGADSKWRSAFRKSEAAAESGFASAAGSFKTYPGYGGKMGLNFGGDMSPFSLTYSYVFGPEGKSAINVMTGGGAVGGENEAIRTFYQRAMAEFKIVMVSIGKDSLNLDFGAGRAFGSMTSRSALTGAAPGAPGDSKASTTWSGFTYDAGLSITSRYKNGNWLELGARYSHFPARPEDGNWSKFSWDPVSGYLAIGF